MALEPGRRSASPDSDGHDSPVPRQWRNQLGAEDAPPKDKHYRKYASGIERALSLFDTTLQEWADYISFLNRLLKALQARPSSVTAIPAKATVAKRLSQCLNPSLPSGVHQKTLEVYSYVFSVIGKDGLSRDLPLYFPGLATVLSFASLTVRAPFLDLLERYFLDLDPRSLRPAMKSVVLALLPGLEEETSEDFDRTLKVVERFKAAIRPPTSQDITEVHSTGDDFFWQCFFLASITGHTRRTGALAYLLRSLPRLGQSPQPDTSKSAPSDAETSAKLAQLVTSPEPGLLIRSFAAGLADEQLLIQRGYLDLLVTHLPLHSDVLQVKSKGGDLELLLRAAVGVTVRRDMSLNRRLWSWLLGPEPPASAEHEGGLDSPTSTSNQTHGFLSSRTTYFEEYGLQPLTQALLSTVKSDVDSNPTERARPYRVCLSLMDRWEIGGLVVPELFLPIVDSVREYKANAASKANFAEVLRSASVFFDGVESGLIYGELLSLMAQAIGPGDVSASERNNKLGLVKFVLTHFNVREEEMITIHAPLTVLSILCMMEEVKNGDKPRDASSLNASVSEAALNIAASLLELVPERAFPLDSAASKYAPPVDSNILAASSDADLLKKIRTFYVADQGNLEAAPPFAPHNLALLLLQKACDLTCSALDRKESGAELAAKSKILILLLSKLPEASSIDTNKLLGAIHRCITPDEPLPFTTYSSILSLSSHMYSANRVTAIQLSDLVVPLVRHAWRYLSSSEPKYHVETVRSLWLLQSALPPLNRDIEAAICSTMLRNDTAGTFSRRPADSGRCFCVLWTHTLHDSPSGTERRGSKTANGDVKAPSRLAGTDHYEVMLTRPLFLLLDALADERTQLFMTIKTWLNSLMGVDKLFGIFITKLSELPFLRRRQGSITGQATHFTEDDDLSLALYYIRSLSSVLRWSPEAAWAVLAKRFVRSETYQPPLSEISKFPPNADESEGRATQLHRAALTVLHQILLNPFAEHLAKLHLENFLIEKLQQSLSGPDPYVQVLLLDVVYASLKLREVVPVELPTSPNFEKRMMMQLEAARSSRASLTERHPLVQPPPPALLKCILAGLSSPSSRPVLDSWVGFLSECLPLYTDSVFQVLIPLVETLCRQVGNTFNNLQRLFRAAGQAPSHGAIGPETTLISLLNGLEQVLANGHDRLLAEEARTQVVKSPDQPQGFFGNMVSGVFSSDAPQTRSATANDRLTVLLAFQDAVRICFTIWSWGQGSDAAGQDATSGASLNYTSLRMRNRARRLLEHLFAAETLECLETVIGIWRGALDNGDASKAAEVFNLLPALDGSRPKHTIPALFNAIYSRTNPSALDPSRRSTLTIELQDADLVIFLVDYTRSLEDDTMDEIWQDCTAFLKDLLGNPFPHRQTLPSLLEFAAILGEKVDNTNFGEQRKMRRELADLFLRLLTAIFTTRPTSFDISGPSNLSEKRPTEPAQPSSTVRLPAERADDVVGILSTIVPNLPKILVENDRVLTAATAVSTNVIGPALRSKSFPDTVSKTMLDLLQELSHLPNNQKAWKKDLSDAFNDPRFFGSALLLVHTGWLPLLRQWTVADKERVPDLLARITPPTTAGIVFGVGATSARLEADRKTQLTLRRVAALVLACGADALVADLPAVAEKLMELLGATATSSPSSTTRAEVYMLLRALVLRTSAVHLAPLWPAVNAELHAAIASVVAADHSAASDTYGNASVMQACKLLDLLVCVAPDEFQLHEWLFVTDTIDAVYRPQGGGYQPVALVDEVCEELGAVGLGGGGGGGGAVDGAVVHATVGSSSGLRRPLLGTPGGISDEVGMERKDELVAKVLRPFFGQLSIYAFEATYAMAPVDQEVCVAGLVKDLFDERSIVKAL
ncbi:Dopey, N-terminal-domain-containing protein [Staphylotrichum tortipilum]|uniref:Dopey, N-terminal-domain-containing protein n=1 Tax=Staphylotrichum tortipilum TaxID=2831512 RepID=A0AAN6MUN3_9PEZI|nr:Dopey, N-terminal-domain-containing protein [Staphylotrichum longicolle]